MEPESIFFSDAFLIGYYVVTVAASLLLVRDTRLRVRNLVDGARSAVYAPLAFGILLVYILFGFEFLESVPYLNWGWLGYNIAFGPFADSGTFGEIGIFAILPFLPILVYMFLHINYLEEYYFRRSKKAVLLWAAIHLAMGVKIHTALILIPVGFLFKWIYERHGVNHAFAAHFATNILVVSSLFLAILA